ncbi:fasciclin domain-containing protein [Catalinimonas niigatensis]|uniref:fasciclin domain-containing protein n=1 Tax=Catalinimonas niigatensis TaxID=1397264 RepID=UPI002665CA61|nr:fasciclin domain-containing protein [Catalinimonas niigatensis]WPP49542.1 fasciclin domain-containing protein [Catalinimonas niigatensis]
MTHPFTFKKLPFLFICLFGFSLIFSACSDDDEGTPPRPTDDLLDIISSTEGLESFDTLVSLLGQGANNRLTSGEYTVFAPNNAAVQKLLSSIGYQSLVELRSDILQNILFYHVVANTYLEANQLDSTITTLGFSQISFEQEGDSVRINPDSQPERTVVTNSFQASNGVVHVTNEVLLSPGMIDLEPLFGSVAGIMLTLRDIPSQDPNFDGGLSTINNVLNAANLLSTLNGSSNYTVLAPVNTAFDDFFFTSNENVTQTANYHVLEGNVDFANSDRMLTTLSGQNLYVSNVENNTYLNGRPIFDLGYGADNGRVIHMLDVLKPAVPLAEMVEYIEALSGNTFTIFKKALEETAIEVPANSTIFMPTDAAFEAAGIITTIDSVALEAEAARIAPAVLSSILQKHVVPDNILFSPDFEAGTLTTLNGAIAVTLEGQNGTITLNDNNAATETNANLQFPANNLVENGIVIHVVTQALLP